MKSEWITLARAKSSESKNLLYKLWRKNRFVKNWNTYIDYKRKFDVLIKTVKYDYYNKKFLYRQYNNKKVWQLSNHVLGRKKETLSLPFSHINSHQICFGSLL